MVRFRSARPGRARWRHADPDVRHASAPLRVLVVDADDRVRESLVRPARASATGSRSSATPASPARPSTRARDRSPDIVIIDPRLPEMDGGLALIGRVRAARRDVRILVMCGDEPSTGRTSRRAADGFIRKTFRPNDLVAAICAGRHPAGQA